MERLENAHRRRHVAERTIVEREQAAAEFNSALRHTVDAIDQANELLERLRRGRVIAKLTFEFGDGMPRIRVGRIEVDEHAAIHRNSGGKVSYPFCQELPDANRVSELIVAGRQRDDAFSTSDRVRVILGLLRELKENLERGKILAIRE